MAANKIPIIIHAGRHKTGTSYLQQFLGVNRERLLQKYSLLYPASGKNPYFHYHHELIEHLGKPAHERSQIVKSFLNEILEKDPAAVLLSSEYLSRSSIDEDFLQNIKSALVNYNVTIIFYLRNQSDFLCSRYAEQVKRGILSYPDNIWKIKADLDYAKFLEKYVNVFGVGKVNAHFFDFAISNGGLLNDFITWVGINDISDFTLPLRGSNKRLPWNYLKLLWYANRQKVARKLVLSRLVRGFFVKGASVFPKIFDGERPITASESKILDKNFKDTNTLVYKNFTEQKYGPILKF